MCDCAERPRCQMRGCVAPSVVTMIRPDWPVADQRALFICAVCLHSYDEAMARLERYEKMHEGDENYRPSLIGMIRYFGMLARDEERRNTPPASQASNNADYAERRYKFRNYNQKQIAQAEFVRRAMSR